MQIILHKSFLKMYAKQSLKIQQKFKESRNLFIEDKFNVKLNNHALKGKWLGHRSINITGNYRAIFREDADVITFVAIGTHSQLYK